MNLRYSDTLYYTNLKHSDTLYYMNLRYSDTFSVMNQMDLEPFLHEFEVLRQKDVAGLHEPVILGRSICT